MRALPMLVVAVVILLSSSFALVAEQGGGQMVRTAQDSGSRGSTGGSVAMSPSVVSSSFITRDQGGAGTLELLVMWRGSPGWFMRRTGAGGSMTSGNAGSGGGSRTQSIRQGGLHLTVTFDPATRIARVLDEDVPLKDSNVILVDQVDDPSGPRILKTLKVETPLGDSNVLNHFILATPELLDYLRCQTQVPNPYNLGAINYACTSAVALGKISAERTVTPIPEGPVQNRAADTTGPPALRRPTGPSEGGSDGVLSPAVVGVVFTHRDASGSNALDLLVLWRGSLGWHLKGGGGGGSSGGSGGSGGRRGTSVRRGGLVLHALFDDPARLCQIDGKDVPLNDHNVVLVDEVDSPSGPKVLKTLRIDPALPEPPRMEIAIRRSPEPVSYLRCDLKLPDARQQTMMDIICGQVVSR